MTKRKCRDPNLHYLSYDDLWLSNKYCRNPVKDIFTIFKPFEEEELEK